MVGGPASGVATSTSMLVGLVLGAMGADMVMPCGRTGRADEVDVFRGREVGVRSIRDLLDGCRLGDTEGGLSAAGGGRLRPNLGCGSLMLRLKESFRLSRLRWVAFAPLLPVSLLLVLDLTPTPRVTSLSMFSEVLEVEEEVAVLAVAAARETGQKETRLRLGLGRDWVGRTKIGDEGAAGKTCTDMEPTRGSRIETGFDSGRGCLGSNLARVDRRRKLPAITRR